MPTKDREAARMLQELLETADILNGYGVMSKADVSTMRVLCSIPPVYTPDRVVAIRTSNAKMSQAVFASLLNVSVSTVQKWESHSANRQPSGAAAKLLHLIETKGIEALLV